MLDALQEKLAATSADSGSKIITAVLVIVLLLLIGHQLIELYRTAVYSPDIKTVKTVTHSSATADYSASVITQRNLFGQTTTDPDQLMHSNLPTTNLAVLLRGVFTSSYPKQASAIIERPDGSARSYSVDSVIYDDTRLHAVFNDRIVLRTNGALETLYFPKPSEENTQRAVNNALAANQIPDNVRQLVQDNMSGDEIRQAARDLSNANMTQEQRKALIRERLLELRQRARENREKNK